MPVFPSVEWFDAVRALINVDPAYKHLGSCDADMGVDVGGRVFRLTFDGLECTAVQEIEPRLVDELDFTLSMPYADWKEMIQNIREHGRADLHHTLNTLDLARPDEFAQARDYYLRDKFYRFNQSFQNFFDASAQIPTEFVDEKAGAGSSGR